MVKGGGAETVVNAAEFLCRLSTRLIQNTYTVSAANVNYFISSFLVFRKATLGGGGSFVNLLDFLLQATSYNNVFSFKYNNLFIKRSRISDLKLFFFSTFLHYTYTNKSIFVFEAAYNLLQTILHEHVVK